MRLPFLRVCRCFAFACACVVCFGSCAPSAENDAYTAFSCVLSDDMYRLRYTVRLSDASLTVEEPEMIGGLTIRWVDGDCRMIYGNTGEAYAFSTALTPSVLGGFADFPETFRENTETDRNGTPQTVTVYHPTGAHTFVITEYAPETVVE